MKSFAVTFALCLVTVPVLMESFVLPTAQQKQRQQQHVPQVKVELERSIFYYNSPTLLYSSSIDTIIEEDQPTTNFKSFKSLSFVYTIMAAILFAMPDRTMTQKLATKWGGAAGFGVAAAVARLLHVNHKREGVVLDPVTQKRLIIGLYGFSFLGLLAVPGEAAFLPTALGAMILTGVLNAAKLWGVLVSFAGLGILKAPWKSMQELLQGTLNTMKGLRVTKEAKKRSLTYRNCLLLVLAGMGSSLMEGIFYIRVSPTSLPGFLKFLCSNYSLTTTHAHTHTLVLWISPGKNRI